MKRVYIVVEGQTEQEFVNFEKRRASQRTPYSAVVLLQVESSE